MCESCLLAQRDHLVAYSCDGILTLNVTQKCHKSIPILDDQNKIFWQLYRKVEPGFIKGRDYDYTAILFCYEIYQIPSKFQQWFFERILLLIGERENIIREEIKRAKAGKK